MYSNTSNYYYNFDNASPDINTPFLDSSSTIDTPFLDHTDVTSEEFMNLIFGNVELNNDVYVAGYLDMNPVAAFSGNPNALLIDKSQATTAATSSLFPPLMSQEIVIPQNKEEPQTQKIEQPKKKAAMSRIKPIKLYQCPSCGHQSKRRFNLNTHMKTHDKNRLKEYDCTGCHKRFDRKHDRDRHLVTVHNKSKYNPCTHCKKTFTRADVLQRHLIKKHHFTPLDFIE